MDDLKKAFNHLSDRIDEMDSRLDRIEQTIELLERRFAHSHHFDLVAVRTLVARENQYPDTYRGFVRMMDRRGVPKLLPTGEPKPSDSRAVTHVSLTQLEGGKSDSTYSVRRRNGFYEDSHP